MKIAVAAALATSVSAICFKGMKLEYFTDKECGGKATKTMIADADDMNSLNEQCNVLDKDELEHIKPFATDFDNHPPKSMTNVCDKTGLHTDLFEDKTCETGEAGHFDAYWDECTEVTKDKLYVKMTDGPWGSDMRKALKKLHQAFKDKKAAND